MRLASYGVTYKTAPVEVRELLAVADGDREPLLRRLCDDGRIAEAMLVNTCNRVELFAVPTAADVPVAELLREALVAGRGARVRGATRHAVSRSGREAVHHLLRVAASLDSMIVGEPQILGQVKEAFREAQRAGTVGPVLDRLAGFAFRAAKDVRTDTGIARALVSIGSVAVDLARRIFARLSDCRVLLIGAGKMGEVTARVLAEAGVQRVYITNRSYDRAEELAERHGWRARRFSELEDLLVEVDVVLSSTGAVAPIITRQTLRPVLRRRKYRPLFLVDIAVPRDVDRDVGDLDTVYLYDIDDLEAVSRENLAGRAQEAATAEAMVLEAVEEVERWFGMLEVQPTLQAIRRRADEVAAVEVQRTFGRRLRHLGEAERSAVERMTQAVVSKLLHPTMMALRKCPHCGRESELLTMARVLHGLDPIEQVAGAEAGAAADPPSGDGAQESR